jgi:preprotein translocase subunit Sec61beta
MEPNPVVLASVVVALLIFLATVMPRPPRT